MDRLLVSFHIESVIKFLEKTVNKDAKYPLDNVKEIKNMNEAIENLKIANSLLIKG